MADQTPHAEHPRRTAATGRGSHIAIASAKVAAIVEAAEQAAEDLRLKTEQRARERIAEADRAASMRVEAADAEIRELLEAARGQAAALEAQAKAAVQQIHAGAAADRAEADRYKEQALKTAEDESVRIRIEAASYAEEITAKAKSDARGIIRDAHDASRGVLAEGKELSDNLNELSVSLRRNAERLLRDVQLAHSRLVAELDQAMPPGAADEPAVRPRRDEPSPPLGGDLDVPEFLPRR
jgi:hypothetical protein